jgi:acetyl/propionyl-CoA carboxylase alpha subunit/acetyl-CoA carboxylase carboxyltransferase component
MPNTLFHQKYSDQRFQRIAIINRGEAAMRMIRAVREVNREEHLSLTTIAFFTTPDQQAMFVHEADDSIHIGAATFVDQTEKRRKNSYLDPVKIEQALLATHADAVWVGWGLASEEAWCAELCQKLGIVFIGPDATVLQLFRNKIRAKRLAEHISIPVVPWGMETVGTLEEAQHQAHMLGYPLLIKPVLGTHGEGILRVNTPDELPPALAQARSEAQNSTGNAMIFLEHALDAVHQVEVQIIADTTGTTQAVGVRDCTVQRHYQKILEESDTAVLSEEQKQTLSEMAIRLCRTAGYCNAGSVEFLYAPDTRAFWFLELNPCLDAEHPITEMTTGLDLVKLQLNIARGKQLPEKLPFANGHAIEVRLYAEDPDHGSAPSPGTLDLFRLATGPGIRIDTGFEEGDVIAPEFHLMLAKIIAWGRNRQEALARLNRALTESAMVVRGGMHNRAFLLDLLSQPALDTGNVDVLWLDQLVQAKDSHPRKYADIALLQAAITSYEAELQIEQAQFFTSAARGRPKARSATGLTMNFHFSGHNYRLIIAQTGPQNYQVATDGKTIALKIERIGAFEGRITCSGQRHRAISAMYGPNHLVEIDGIAHRITREEGEIIRAPGPCVVVSIPITRGDHVEVGARLIVVEAMKMEMTISASFSGRVTQVYVTNNVQVDTGAPLLQLEPLSWQEETLSGEHINFSSHFTETGSTQTPEEKRDQLLAALRNQMLGYDVNEAETKRLLAALQAIYHDLPVHDQQLQTGEDELLSIFADISVLFHREQDLAEEQAQDIQVHSPEHDMLTYLRSRDRHLQHLSTSFKQHLQHALTHYKVQSLDTSPDLDNALFMIYKSHQNATLQRAIIIAILERRLSHINQLLPFFRQEHRKLFERLQFAARGRYPIISDLAREVHFGFFDEPLFEEARTRVYKEIDAHLLYLVEHQEASDQQEHVTALVDCPQPLQARLTSRFPEADETMRRLMLEVLTRRYYRIHQLRDIKTTAIDGQEFATALYDFAGAPTHVVAMFARYTTLESAITALAHFITRQPSMHDVVSDLYVWHPDPFGDIDAMGEGIRAFLNKISFTQPITRIVVTVVGAERGYGITSATAFTYRPKENSYQENRLYRGLHPMMGKRLNIWRLSNFTIKRLPSVEDVYLFHAIARDNPKDERLFAIAEVRDMTPLYDNTGKIVQIPHMERMFTEALASIRLHQSHLPLQQRLLWNRVLLYIWPPVAISTEEFEEILRNLWPLTEELGLEKVVISARLREGNDPNALNERVLHLSHPGGHELAIRMDIPNEVPISTLDEYRQKVVQLRKRGLTYPYEIIQMLTSTTQNSHSTLLPGDFTEYDLDATNRLLPVERPYGKNQAGIVVGVILNYSASYPEGIMRVLLLGDPSKGMGSIAEPECRRINAAIDLAERLQVPVEWFALSAGAKISMDSGTENMDWVSRTLRRIITFTQAGGRINIVVNGINVGAQPYWNSVSTILMHTRGTLIMTPNGAMVLTGKQSLDYSGSVSAADNYGIGGYEQIMGPNGEAQYFAPDLNTACQLLMRYYEHTYVAPSERFPRRASTSDLIERDIRDYPYIGTQPDDKDFSCVGDLFSEEKNIGRKHPFDMRQIMTALIDSDHQPLERWHDMRDAENAIVWDAHIGGYPVAMIGIESHSIARYGFIPGDGPEQWTAGTLFPMSSKKIARTINTANGNRPVIVIANLSGFDGSPESMRNMELEFGAEIGRAVVNFQGPIIFCTVARFHGGSFVVFSGALNENVEVAAVEGSYASVIGGVPAAAVVLTRDVDARIKADPRVKKLQEQLMKADGIQKATLQKQLNEFMQQLHAEKVGEVASDFDHTHTIERARRVGSVDYIIPAFKLRPYLVEALERGIAREMGRLIARQ